MIFLWHVFALSLLLRANSKPILTTEKVFLGHQLVSNASPPQSNLNLRESQDLTEGVTGKSSFQRKFIVITSPPNLTAKMDVHFTWLDFLDINYYISNMKGSPKPGLAIGGNFWGWMPVAVVLDPCIGIGCFWGDEGMVAFAIASALELLVCGIIGGEFQGQFFLNLVALDIYISDIRFMVNGLIYNGANNSDQISDITTVNMLRGNTASSSNFEKNKLAAKSFANLVMEKGLS